MLIKKKKTRHANVQVAFTLELICDSATKWPVFQDKTNCPLVMLKTLEHRVVEHVHGSLGNSDSVICYDTFWRSLPVGVIKINVDVTILTYSTTTAAVVRNDLGQVIKAWA